MTLWIKLAAVMAAALVAAMPAAARSAAKPGADWPTMPRTQKKHLPIKKAVPAKKKPAMAFPGLIAKADKAFGLSVVLQSTRQDFYSEDVKRVVIGLDLASGRVLGLVVVKDDDTWGLYAAPVYVAFFPNKRAQARRAGLVWLDAAGWTKFIKNQVATYTRE
jgi:hypothetical protein